MAETYASTHDVGPYSYKKRPYTPKRQGEDAGHGWVRDHPRAEVGAEAKVLLDEIDRLRGEQMTGYQIQEAMESGKTVEFRYGTGSWLPFGEPWNSPHNWLRKMLEAGHRSMTFVARVKDD